MNNYQKFYDELNKDQTSAVDTIKGPLLVLAGPGTGKTQLLSIRAASILKKAKVAPENILILTYTNSAAKAMKERLAKVVGPESYDIEVGTFHSFANSIIQESEEAVNYVGDKIQMTEVERIRAIEYALDHTEGVGEIHPFGAPYLYTSEILQKISELKRDGITPPELSGYLKGRKENDLRLFEEKHMKRLEALAIIYKVYEELKQGSKKDIFDERGRYDFDDMILYATEAMKKEKVLRKKYQDLYSYTMVDEFQDTNGAQLELLFTLLGYSSPNLCCVGDDDQSIYRFQGASVGNFKLLCKRFPDIKVLSLKNNYRSTRELIDISKKIIELIPQKERMAQKRLESVKDYRDKEIEFREFTTTEEELIYIVDKIRQLKEKIEKDETLNAEERSHPYNNIAILVRKRASILAVIDALLQAGIPYATDGKEDISGEKRVRQLMDILELAHTDPNDREKKDFALYKVLTADYHEIPHIDILRFINHVNAKNERNKFERRPFLAEFLDYFSSKRDDIKFEKKEKLISAAAAINRLLNDAQARTVHTILMDYIKDAGIFRYILKTYSDKKILRIRELRALSSFVNMVKNADLANPAIRLDEFMMEIKTRKDHNMPIEGNLVTMTQDGVRVFTAHGSKGQEFHSVIMPFCLQNRNWPARPIPEKIPLPLGIFKTKERARDKELLKQLYLHDETRLFYVAMTRAKSNLIFTASPGEDAISSFYLTRLDIDREAPQHFEEEDILIESLEKTDSEDPFIGTESVLKDLVGNLSLNPTRLNNYLICRRKFLYNDVLKIPGPKKKSLVFGNCVHKALEETYREYIKTRTFPDFIFFTEAFLNELRFQGVDKSIEIHCTNETQIRKLKGWFELARKRPVMPISLEKKLIITVGEDIVFTGKYDKVEWEDEKRGLVRIVDYKTGRPDDHLKNFELCEDLASPDCDGYLRQLVSYKLLFDRDKSESKGMVANKGELVFVEPLYADLRRLGYKKGDYVSKAVVIQDAMVAELERVIIDVWRDIKELQFGKLPKRDETKCGNCDFDRICWG